MSTLAQIATVAGGLAGLGVAILVWRLVPAQPHLRATLDRLAPVQARDLTVPAATGETDLRDRLGLWAQRSLPIATWGKPPIKELAVLRIPLYRFYGEKVLYALIGFVFPPLAAFMFTLMGVGIPVLVPAVAGLGFGAALSFLPDYNARSDAREARTEFTRALSAYVELVALERAAGSGARQSLEVAAAVGDSWVFQRISEELARSRWSGVSPWNSLTALADELGLPALAEIADTLRLSGEEGAAIYTTLRARAASMRAAMLSEEQAAANAVGERMTFPVSALSLIFLVILAAPAVLRIIGSG